MGPRARAAALEEELRQTKAKLAALQPRDDDDELGDLTDDEVDELLEEIKAARSSPATGSTAPATSPSSVAHSAPEPKPAVSQPRNPQGLFIAEEPGQALVRAYREVSREPGVGYGAQEAVHTESVKMGILKPLPAFVEHGIHFQ